VSDQPSPMLALVRRAELVEFLPTGTLARRTAGVPGPPPGMRIHLKLDTRIGVVREHERFVVLAAISVRTRVTPEDPKPFARFLYRVNVRYTNAGDATDETLLEFARTNGMVHIWPYARSFVQAAATSMGLVPVTLPFFRVASPNGKVMEATPVHPD
jgi:hypothetical protein